MAIHSIVLEQDLDKLKAGTVIQLSEELASNLIASGVAREATEEDLAGNEEEEVVDEMPVDVQEEVAVATRSIDNATTKAVKEEIAKQVAKTVQRPSLKAKQPLNRHISGSDELRTGGFKSMGDAVQNYILSRKGDWTAAKKFNRYSDLRTKVTAASIGGGSGHQGGDLVPQEWSEQLWRLSFDAVPDLLGKCTKYEMRNQVENIPIWVQASAATSLVAEVTAENTQLTPTVPVTATQQLSLVKGDVFVNVTDELLRFSPYNVENTIKAVAPERIRYLTNGGIVNGTNSQANLIGGASTITVLRAKNNVLSYIDVLKMESALHESFSADAIWLCNKSALPQVYNIAYPNDDATTKIPAFTPGGFENMLGAKPEGKLLGREIWFVENCPAITAKGGLILYSPSSIAAGYTGLVADSTPYLYFDYAVNTFRFLFYYDSVSLPNTVYTRADGSTASNVIVLSATSSS